MGVNRCAMCRYFEHEVGDVGQCRAHTPQPDLSQPWEPLADPIVDESTIEHEDYTEHALTMQVATPGPPSRRAIWPVVLTSEWCGEWAPRRVT